MNWTRAQVHLLILNLSKHDHYNSQPRPDGKAMHVCTNDVSRHRGRHTLFTTYFKKLIFKTPPVHWTLHVSDSDSDKVNN